jgi:acyl-CoA thioester hydrolase
MSAVPTVNKATRPTPFVHVIAVSADEIDELGHASNIAYVRWIQDVALAHSVAVGLDVDAYRAIGSVFFVRRHEIDYLRPALRGERLEVRTWIESVFAAKCVRGTEIVKISDDTTPVIVAKAMTTWGCVEIATGRPTRIPDAIRVAFGQPTMRATRPS